MNSLNQMIAASLACLLTLTACAQPTQEYLGQFTPDAEYVLSGQLAADLPPLPEVDFNFDQPGFAMDRLSQVPEVGVHPRVIMSPSDLDGMREQVQQGDSANAVFRITLRDLRNKAAVTDPSRKGQYDNSPWGGLSEIGCKALLAHLTHDEALGREAAQWTVKHAEFLIPKVKMLNEHPDAAGFTENFYYFSRTGVILGGVPYPDAYRQGGAERVAELAKNGITFVTRDCQWSYTSLGEEYDYAYDFMTQEERDLVRGVIASITANKYSTGMEIPGHFFINNHMSMGALFYTLAIAIEGEEGYDPRVVDQYTPRLMDKLTYDISPDGTLFENVKGFIPVTPIVAAGRRGDRTHLRHNHLYEMMHSRWINAMNLHNRYLRRGRNRPGLKKPAVGEGPDEPRFWVAGAGAGPGGNASFQWGWVLHWLYPDDKMLQSIQSLDASTENYDLYDGSDDETNYGGKIHYNNRMMVDVQLLASAGFGQIKDYQTLGPTQGIDNPPLEWTDLHRGISMVRNGWDADDLFVHYECRSDVYYGGHEAPEHGDFSLSAHGINWSPYTGAYMDSYFRNMVLIDGKAGVYQPVAGKLVSVTNTPEAATIFSDATDGYEWRKREKSFHLWHKMFDQAPAHGTWLKPMGYRVNRDYELPFQKHMREFYDGFAHLDWGPWHGETRGPEYFERWNDVDHVYRTLHLARGERPYVLIADDVKKDDKPHQYDWNFMLPGDAVLYDAISLAQNRHLEPNADGAIGTDLIFCMGDAPLKRDMIGIFGGQLPDIKPTPKDGDPMLLVRVLWRNTEFPYPLPSYERAYRFGRVKVPAYAVEPEFRIMLFPYRFGESLPLTQWSDDRRTLTVDIDGQVDRYLLDQGENGRTVFSMTRDEKQVAQSGGQPALPEFQLTAGHTPDRNLENNTRTVLFTGDTQVKFQPASSGSEIRYTLDGSEPSEDATLYLGPFTLDKTATIKAQTFSSYWPYSDTPHSQTREVRFEKRAPLASASDVDAASLSAGLEVEVFEKRHTIFDERGFFTGDKIMLPELNKLSPIASGVVQGMGIPEVVPQQLPVEMADGFYRYRGFFKANKPGVYDFQIFSTGPITFTLGGETVLSATGPYGQSQKNRYGSAVLDQGIHALELVVHDPVFWKAGAEGPLPLHVGVKRSDDSVYAPIDSSSLLHQPAGQPSLDPKDDAAPALKPAKIAGLVSGLVESRYDFGALVEWRQSSAEDHSGSLLAIPSAGLEAGYFDAVKQLQPYSRRAAMSLSGNPTLLCLIAYDGYFRVREPGIYQFALDGDGANELWVGDNLVARNRVQGDAATPRVQLEAGWYPLSMLVSKSTAKLQVRMPNRAAFEPVSVGDLGRPSDVKTVQSDRLVASIDCDELSDDGSVPTQGKTALTVAVDATPIEGRSGKALQLNGSQGRVMVRNVSLPDDKCTVAFWFKLDARADFMAIEGMTKKFDVRIRGDKAIWANYYRNYNDRVQAMAEASFADGQWHHLAASFGTHTRVYLDGELIGEKQAQPANRYAEYVDARATELYLMKGSNGAIDEVKVWNRVLSSEEISEVAASE